MRTNLLLFGAEIPLSLIITTGLKIVNWAMKAMEKAEMRRMVTNEQYVKARQELDVWLAEADQIWAEQMAKPRDEVNKDLEEDLSQ